MSTVRSIIRHPDERLRERATNVNRASLKDALYQATIDDLISTLQERNGRALSAPQIGINARLVVVQLDNNEILTLVNPTLKPAGFKKQPSRESCLSIPGFIGAIRRYPRIEVKAMTRTGEALRGVFEGREATLIQHGVDHLNGKLFTDNARHLLPIEAEGAF